MIEVTHAQHERSREEQGEGTGAQALRLPAHQQNTGEQAGPIEDFHMLPEAFVDRGQQGGQAIGPESVEEVQAGARQRGHHKGDQRRLGQTGHSDTPCFVIVEYMRRAGRTYPAGAGNVCTAQGPVRLCIPRPAARRHRQRRRRARFHGAGGQQAPGIKSLIRFEPLANFWLPCTLPESSYNGNRKLPGQRGNLAE